MKFSEVNRKAETPISAVKPGVKRGRPTNPTGRKITISGMVLIRLEDGTWVAEHRKVLENLLGRKLRSTEKVRWKDGDKANNAPDNLELWEEMRTWPKSP